LVLIRWFGDLQELHGSEPTNFSWNGPREFIVLQVPVGKKDKSHHAFHNKNQCNADSQECQSSQTDFGWNWTSQCIELQRPVNQSSINNSTTSGFISNHSLQLLQRSQVTNDGRNFTIQLVESHIPA
jgi:hypothetical protein